MGPGHHEIWSRARDPRGNLAGGTWTTAIMGPHRSFLQCFRCSLTYVIAACCDKHVVMLTLCISFLHTLSSMHVQRVEGDLGLVLLFENKVRKYQRQVDQISVCTGPLFQNDEFCRRTTDVNGKVTEALTESSTEVCSGMFTGTSIEFASSITKQGVVIGI